MNAECKIEIDFKSSDKVKTIIKSIEVDDFHFVKSKISGKSLVAEISADSVSSLIHTLDDYLACVSIADKVVDKN